MHACRSTLEDPTVHSNLDSLTTFVAVGGEPPYTFSRTGTGVVDDAGVFRAPAFPGTARVVVTDAAGDTRAADVAFAGDYLYQAGGFEPGLDHGEVWRSLDGVTWEMIGLLPAPRQHGAFVVHDDQLFYLGGATNVDNMKHDEVYSSPDGVTWSMVGRLPAVVSAPAYTVLDGRIWIAGGYQAVDYNATLWSSQDGASWRIESPLPTALHGSELIPYEHQLTMFGGHEAGGQMDTVRTTTNQGASWTAVGMIPVGGEYHGATVYHGDVWLAGGIGLSDRVVTSTGGATWMDVMRLPIARTTPQAIEFDNSLWILGGGVPQILRTDTGASWTTVSTFPLTLSGILAVQFTPH